MCFASPCTRATNLSYLQFVKLPMLIRFVLILLKLFSGESGTGKELCFSHLNFRVLHALNDENNSLWSMQRIISPKTRRIGFYSVRKHFTRQCRAFWQTFMRLSICTMKIQSPLWSYASLGSLWMGWVWFLYECTASTQQTIFWPCLSQEEEVVGGMGSFMAKVYVFHVDMKLILADLHAGGVLMRRLMWNEIRNWGTKSWPHWNTNCPRRYIIWADGYWCKDKTVIGPSQVRQKTKNGRWWDFSGENIDERNGAANEFLKSSWTT